MLVLSRKVGEAVDIGGNVRVTVTRVTGNRVRLGIDAPPELAIRRGEFSHLVGPPNTATEKGDAGADRGGEVDRPPPNVAAPAE